jgi:hypothetical protein
MRVLYLWNTAGVFTPVADWLIENGHDAKIVMRSMFDIYRHTQVSQAAIMVDTPRDFYRMTVKMIRNFKPDIIHISSSLEGIVISRAIAWRTPIIFSYHGSDARDTTGKPHKVVVRLADYIHVSTPDLQSYGNWIDRPIPTIFYYRGGRKLNTALMFYKSHFYADKRDMAREWSRKHGIELTILDELHPGFPIPNDQMPELFSKFEYFLDWKDQKDELYALSKTALEALSCGCKVIHDSNLEKPILPSEFKTVGVEPYITLYKTIKKASLWKTFRRLFYTAIAVFWMLSKRGFGR